LIDSEKNKLNLKVSKNDGVNLDSRLSEPSWKRARYCTLKGFKQCLRVKLSPPIIVVKTQHRIGKSRKVNTRLNINRQCERQLRAEAHKD